MKRDGSLDRGSVLKPSVLKPSVLKPSVLKPSVLGRVGSIVIWLAVMAVGMLWAGTAVVGGGEPTFRKLRLTETFYAEGAGIADIDRDGHGDAIYGPYWYAGPDFQTKHEIYAAEEFDPHHYSNNFITMVSDLDRDGWVDVAVNVWPGKEVAWFQNPGTANTGWARHVIHPVVDNESPTMGNVTGDDRPELIFHTDGILGIAFPREATATAPWQFQRCSAPEKWGQYTHGLGFGDVNGDGRKDLLMAGGWWEQPVDPQSYPWRKHPHPFAGEAAQIHTYDVDGDGDNDVITSVHAHGYGLTWWENVREGEEIRFVEHVIMSTDANVPYEGVQFSQLHAVELADLNGDGWKDIVTGKRYWAHGPQGDADPNGAAVLYWFELVRGANGDVHFRPHLIDKDSGVGTQFAIGDLNGDRRLDIVTGNKKGGFVFLQEPPGNP